MRINSRRIRKYGWAWAERTEETLVCIDRGCERTPTTQHPADEICSDLFIASRSAAEKFARPAPSRSCLHNERPRPPGDCSACTRSSSIPARFPRSCRRSARPATRRDTCVLHISPSISHPPRTARCSSGGPAITHLSCLSFDLGLSDTAASTSDQVILRQIQHASICGK